MKKILMLLPLLVLLFGCKQDENMSSPPAAAPAGTNAPSTNAPAK